jgi:hypothetical protein
MKDKHDVTMAFNAAIVAACEAGLSSEAIEEGLVMFLEGFCNGAPPDREIVRRSMKVERVGEIAA